MQFGVPMPSWQQKATRADPIARGSSHSASSGTLACTYASCTGTGRAPSPPCEVVRGAATGRPEVIAEDERDGAVRLTDSTEEVGEQGGARRGGADGGKRWDQEECGTAKHGPDTEPGSRVTSAGPHTRGRYQEQEGTPHGAPASCRHRLPAVGLLQFEEARSARRR